MLYHIIKLKVFYWILITVPQRYIGNIMWSKICLTGVPEKKKKQKSGKQKYQRNNYLNSPNSVKRNTFKTQQKKWTPRRINTKITIQVYTTMTK